MKKSFTILQSTLLFTFILLAPHISKSQNWVVGTPVNMVLTSNLFHSNYCYPTADQHFTVSGSTVTGVNYYLYINSAPLDSVYIFPGNDTLATGDSILIPTGANYYALYFFNTGGLLDISIKAVGIPTIIGEAHPCQPNFNWASNLMICDEGLTPSIEDSCYVAAGSNLSVEIFGTNTDCFESCTGIADASVSGGSFPYSYLWSNGDTTTAVTDLCIGVYAVTVTDANGTTVTDSVTITSPPQIVVDTFITDASCITCADGSITIVVTGGVPPYEIGWNNNDSTATIDSLLPGEYLYMVTDSNGCIVKSPLIVGVASGIKNIGMKELINIYPNPVADELFISINQNQTGLIEITDLLGRRISASTNFNYYSENKIDVSQLTSGFYFISLKFNDGSFAVKQFVK